MPVSPLFPLSRSEAFRLIATRKQLAAWFRVTDKKLCYLLYKKKVDGFYREFSIPKRSGGKRLVSAPSGFLIYLQRKILEAINEIFVPSSRAFGFVKGRSIVNHASAHRNKRWVLCVDIKDFFPSINFGRIRGLFMAPPFSFGAEVATCLAQICCLNGVLPQGAPTSPALSNLICLSLDRRMKEMGRKYRFSYSRYADDICISSNINLPPLEVCKFVEGRWVVGSELIQAFGESGFSINHAKTKFKLRTQRQLVTGLIANRKVGMPREWRRQLRVLLHLRDKYGPKEAMDIVKTWSRNPLRRSKSNSIDSVISGKSGFAYHLEKFGAPNFTTSLFRNYPEARGIMPNPYESFSIQIFTEGKTDGVHLLAARRFFKSIRKFKRLNIFLGEGKAVRGSADLLGRMTRLAKNETDQLTVGILDCDEPAVMAREGLQPGSFKRLGGSVYLMCLARPLHVSEGELFCIEDLYSWDEASKFDRNERRLFKTSEFGDNNLDVTGRFELSPNASDSIYVTSAVRRVGDGHSALLSKVDFAGYINRLEFPFKNIGFYGFAPSFATLAAIVRDYVGSSGGRGIISLPESRDS